MRIIYPPTIIYEHLFQRPQHLMNAIARNFRELNVYFYSADNQRNEIIEPSGLHVVPYSYQLEEPSNETTILWISYPPTAIEMIERFQPDFVVFDVIDSPVGVFSHWENNWEVLARRANIIFASSSVLYDTINALSDIRTAKYLLKNACEPEDFKTTRNHRFTPGDKPLIGFVGAIASWLDWDLIHTLIKERPDYNYRFIGPLYDRCPVTPLLKYPNVDFTGLIEYKYLPQYMKDMDILLMPFDVNNPVTSGVNPVKMYEYCATGKEIISTDMPELRDLRKIVTISSTKNFLSDLDIVVEHLPGEDHELRIKYAEDNDWDTRARFAIDRIKSMIRGNR